MAEFDNGDDMRNLTIVHSEAWDAVVQFWDQRGVDVMRIPDSIMDPPKKGDQQEGYYYLSPRSLRLSGKTVVR